MRHNLFKPKNFEEGRHEVVGDCNGFTMQERWEKETPAFAKAIVRNIPPGLGGEDLNPWILDYGCGVGRLANGILKQYPFALLTIMGVDASGEMLDIAAKNRVDDRFLVCPPNLIKKDLKFSLAYCVYVLQHVPAIEIREILARIHYHLKDDGIFIYCSSDYRMAIRYDGQGFFDDRFLGVDLRAEIARFFDPVGPLFTQEELDGNLVLKKMIQGDLPHPALVFKKKALSTPYFDAQASSKAEELARPPSVEIPSIKPVPETIPGDCQTKLLFMNRLSPGDLLVMTNAIRDLHKAHPGKFLTDVRTPCSEIFQNNPYITALSYNVEDYQRFNEECSHLSDKDQNIDKKHCLRMNGDVLMIDMHYPLIHTSGLCGWHFGYGHRGWLEDMLGVKISQTDIRPELYLSEDEKNWSSPYVIKSGDDSPYIVLNAGSKKDNFSLKQYPYFQDVVYGIQQFLPGLKIVQIGQVGHNHESLKGVFNMVGQTNIRDLIRLIYKSQAVITCVSFPMHIAAALDKPCVVVAGALEAMRWEAYQTHQFLAVNGCLPCASAHGCWRKGLNDCNNKILNIPRCMTIIQPADVVRSLMRYYDGGVLERPVTIGEVAHAE